MTPDPSAVLRHELTFTRTLRHPPAVVWAALVDPEQLSMWWPFTATAADMSPGGSITFDDGEGTTLRAEITEISEERVLEFVEDGNDVVRFELHDLDNGTRLVFSHRFDRGPAPERPAAGWHQTLDALSSVLARKEPTWFEDYDNSELVAGYATAFSMNP